MKLYLSNGLGSEYIVIDAKSREMISDVLILFPLKDKSAFKVMQDYVKSGNAPIDIMQAFARYEAVWDAIEDKP